jgi:hypothetical protein
MDKNGATLHYADGTKEHYVEAAVALKIYYELPRHVRVAFRHDTDDRPVYSWDYVSRF